MRSFAAYIVLVLLLVAVGGVSWFAGKTEERVAAAEYNFVTLRYERAADELQEATKAGIFDPLIRRISPLKADETAAARYWAGDYESLNGSEDPAVKLLEANSDYRALRRAGGPWQQVVTRLDTVAKKYADVIRAEPNNEDAAYNYEFVLRLRSIVATAKQPLVPVDPTTTGLSVHGVPGAPPEESDAKKFKMIVPMLPDERQEAEEAGRAGRKIRKG